MKIDDFQAPDPRLSFLSIAGGIATAMVLLVSLESWAIRINKMARDEAPSQTSSSQAAPTQAPLPAATSNPSLRKRP